MRPGHELDTMNESAPMSICLAAMKAIESKLAKEKEDSSEQDRLQ